jgi:predicted amidohydrolase
VSALSIKPFRVALAQVLSDADIDAVIDTAAEAKADVVVFPEMFSNGYSKFDSQDATSRSAWIDDAVELHGEYTEAFCAAARRAGVAVVATFLEKADDKPFNSAVLIDRSGEIVLHKESGTFAFLTFLRKLVHREIALWLLISTHAWVRSLLES